MIIVGGTKKQLGVLSNDERKGREERILTIGSIATSGHIWSTSSSSFYTYYILFQSIGSQKSNTSNSVQIRVETKKLWSLQENWAELKENFAHCESRCETTCKNFFFSETTSKSGETCETTSEKANQLAKIHPSCKNPKSKFAWLLFLVRNGFAQCEPPLCHDYYSKSAL